MTTLVRETAIPLQVPSSRFAQETVDGASFGLRQQLVADVLTSAVDDALKSVLDDHREPRTREDAKSIAGQFRSLMSGE